MRLGDERAEIRERVVHAPAVHRAAGGEHDLGARAPGRGNVGERFLEVVRVRVLIEVEPRGVELRARRGVERIEVAHHRLEREPRGDAQRGARVGGHDVVGAARFGAQALGVEARAREHHEHARRIRGAEHGPAPAVLVLDRDREHLPSAHRATVTPC